MVKAVLAVSGQWDGNNVLPSFMISSSPGSKAERTGERGDSPRSLFSLSLSLSLNNLCCNSVGFRTLPATNKKEYYLSILLLISIM